MLKCGWQSQMKEKHMSQTVTELHCMELLQERADLL